MADYDVAKPKVLALLRHMTADCEHEIPEEAAKDRAVFDAWWSRLCAWPPNVFAVTAAILHESGIYRQSPLPKWEGTEYVREAGLWLEQINSAVSLTAPCCIGAPALTPKMIGLGAVLHCTLTHELEAKDDPNDEALRQGLIELHSLADEACHALGLPISYVYMQIRNREPREPGRKLLADKLLHAGITRLCDTGTLSCFHRIKIRVLPKKHTPQVGITLRSMSLNVGAIRGEVKVGWRCPRRFRHDIEARTVPDAERQMNVLLMPWPYEINPSAFKCQGRLHAAAHEFEYEAPPTCKRDGRAEGPKAYLHDLLLASRERGIRVDGVVLPELALTPPQFEELKQCAAEFDPKIFLLAGVARPPSKPGRDPTNEAWLHVEGEQVTQEKHHKWCVTAGQIRQYHLGSALLADDERSYWERMHVGRRSISFVHLRPSLTLCHLVCEDLARVEPVAEVVRAVGPNLVVALLLDGPQLEKRWPGRYASVFADDPGSSVLTLSSLGMVSRSRGREDKQSMTIALWKDQRTGTRELSLNPGAHALVLSLATNMMDEWTFDGRLGSGSAGVLTFAGVQEIKL